MDSKKKAGIRDIAALAGVSIATVSYVLNHVEEKSISAETAERVISAAKALNYTPNAGARLLRTGKTRCVAVRLSATLSIPRYYSLLEGIRACLDEQGYHMLLINDQPVGGMPAYIEACLSARADAIIYVSSNRQDIPERELAVIRKNGIPLSAVDCMSGDSEVSSVVYDYYAASSLRVEELHRHGVPRVVYLTPQVDNVKFDLRIAGLLEAAMNCGMSTEIIPLSGKYPPEKEKKAAAPKRKILDFPFDVSNAERGIYYLEPDKIEWMKALIYSLPGDTGVLHDFPTAQPLVSDFLYKRHLLGLLEEEPFPWHVLSVAHVFPHYEIGYEAAVSLLEAIAGKAPRKLSIRPLILPTDPEIF